VTFLDPPAPDNPLSPADVLEALAVQLGVDPDRLEAKLRTWVADDPGPEDSLADPGIAP